MVSSKEHHSNWNHSHAKKMMRGSSLSSAAAARSLFRPPSLSAVALYIILLFAFSIFVFLLTTRHVLEDESKPLFFAKSQSQPQSHSLEMEKERVWDAPHSYGLHPCLKPTAKFKAAQGLERYITVRSNGGLNQMRTGISDMVAVAHIMNATLVIPQLDKRSFWQDSSKFSDIFDEIHFITTLRDNVRIVKELPAELESVPRARKHFMSWSSVGYYEEMTQLWKDHKVIHVPKSDSRLANNNLPLDIQRLRCRAMYAALRFSPSIEGLGKHH